MKFRWSLAPAQPLLASQLANQLRLSPLLAQCLLNRSLSDPQAINLFLQPRLQHLSDPFLLPDMELAVERLFQARERKESLVIFGDYDVDGVTSTALLLEVLSRLGWSANYYLPHRMDEGYGLSQEAVENCLNKFPTTLLLAVDCGSTAVQSIAGLKQRNVDVIVLDHHQVSSPAPDAFALVNPHKLSSAPAAPIPGTPSLQHPPPSSHQSTNPPIHQSSPPSQHSTTPSLQHPVPFSELCSVGLAFKLAHALLKRGRQTGLPGANEFDLRPLLDLVALGTIADLVPLLNENRILVSAGLQRLNETRRPGLLALKQVSRSPSPLGVYEVGFQLAPRLNAAGRLETAEESLRLLLAPTLAEAQPLAQNLDARNRERQQLERDIAEQAIAAVRSRFNPQTDFVIVEGRQPWHVGVVGIVASRVLQQFYRPTIIVGGDGSEWRGSGRSIAGFDLAAALRECNHLLVRHGGHAMAAGLSLAADKLDAFRSRLNDVARQTLQPHDLDPPLRLDAEVGLDEISVQTLTPLGRLKPMGQGNPPIHFCSRNLVHQRPLQRIGGDKQHVKMWLTDGAITHEAVWWGAGNESLPVGTFDVAFSPQINEYNGRRTVQLKTLDWRRSQPSPSLALG